MSDTIIVDGGDSITVSVDSVANPDAEIILTVSNVASHSHVAADILDFTSAVVAAAPPTTNASLLTTGTLSASRLPASGVAAGTYSSVTVDTTGRVTAGGTHTVGWSDVTNKPAEFPPSSHTHAAGDITSGRLTSSRLPLNPDFGGNATFAGPVTFQGGLTGESWSLPANGNATLASVAAGSATLDTITIPKGVGDYPIAIGNGVISADAGNKALNFNAGTITNLTIGWDYVTSKPSAFTPASHTHGSITNDGKLGTTSGLVVTTGSGGILQASATIPSSAVSGLGGAATLNVGTTTGTVAAGDDSRFHTRSHAITSSSDHTATAWRLFYSNGSGVVTELALGNSGQALLSNGASAVPSWGSAGSNSASDLTTGTLADARLSQNVQNTENIYLWASFR